MKKLLILLPLLALVLTGCGLTNEQIISEKDKCEKAGMDYSEISDINFNTYKIICTKKK